VPAGSLAKAALVGAKTVNGPAPFSVVDEVGGLHGGDERGVVGRVDGVVDDVLVREHLLAADHRIALWRERRRRERRETEREATSCLLGFFMSVLLSESVESGRSRRPIEQGLRPGSARGWRQMRSIRRRRRCVELLLKLW
jgi:hypothetical protein